MDKAKGHSNNKGPAMQEMLEKGKPGYKRTIALIVVLGAAPPIATDVYLPALPQMPAVFNASEALINLTLMGFFLFMAVGTLIFGPVSDKYGRKVPLLVATVMFSSFGLLSGLSSNVWVLILSRVLQGIGGGGMVAISMALVKDCFTGKVRERVLVLIQAAGVVAPMCAPVIGAAVLEVADWHWCFFVQAILGAAALLLVIPMRESLPRTMRIRAGVLQTVGRLFVVGKNKAFIAILLMSAVLSAPFMGYISCASYVYIDFFELSTFQYSLFFATNSALSIVGAGLALVISGRIPVKSVLTGVIALSLAAGVGLLLAGHLSPFAFLIIFGVYALMGSVSRPFTTNILLEQQEGDTGSASSLINFTFNVAGSIGMVVATLPWPNYIVGLGTMICVVSVAALAIWVALLRSSVQVKGL